MKDLIAGLALLMVLIIIFSAAGVPEVLPGWGLFGDDYPDDRGMILPGGGNEMPDAVMQMDEQTASDQMKENQMRTGKDSRTAEMVPAANKDIYKEENSMGEMMVGIWHGVAAVLIGETAALMVAAAWLKIKGKQE